MELAFEKSQLQYWQQMLSQMNEMELTQEVKLPSEMPDLGNIMGAWGQVLIRGKEWRSGGIGITGGVMCWVMYIPEEENKPRVVEGWLPFQAQLELPEHDREGQICVNPALKLVDARGIGAGKIMVRACVNLQVKAGAITEADWYQPPATDPDIQLLKKTYSLQMPCEAGEKAFTLDEEFSLEGAMAEKLLYYCLRPVITEKKVMAGKLVFRGSAMVNGLYEAAEGLRSFQMDIPFAQYAELEKEHDADAIAMLYPAVTGLELELTGENAVHMKAGMVGQYIICDRQEITAVPDAYSTGRNLQMHSHTLQLPNVKEGRKETIFAQFSPKDSGRLLDAVFYMDHPKSHRHPDGIEHQLCGKYQLLRCDSNGNLQSETGKWEQVLKATEDEELFVSAAGYAEAAGIELMMDSVSMEPVEIVSVASLTLTEKEKTQAQRPSLILRKKGEDSLWQVAKQTGSTVERIMQANGLDAEPPADKMLLIPV